MVQRYLIAALLTGIPLYGNSCAISPMLFDRFDSARAVERSTYVRKAHFAVEYRLRAESLLKRIAPNLSMGEFTCGHSIELTPRSRPLLDALLRYAEGGPAVLLGNLDTPGAKVVLSSQSDTQSTIADMDGYYIFTLPSPGRYRIEGTHRRQRIAFRTIYEGFLDEFEIPANTSAYLDGMRVRSPGLAGRLLSSTGTPIPKAFVTAMAVGERFGRLARSNASGSFHIPNLPPGSYHLVVSSASKEPSPLFRSSYYADKAILAVPKNGHGAQDIEFRAAPAAKLIPIRAFLTRGSYGDYQPGQKISFRLLNANSHVDLLEPELDFTCTIDSALSCFIPLVENELYRPTSVLLPEWTVRAVPGGHIHLWHVSKEILTF